ncbi:MAG: FAD-dependent oxidoreductase, partial [Kiritimatiellae bacterium]|nr:FAD-dependent oxidoreductase [Kiritimatiellia bacterium]
TTPHLVKRALDKALLAAGVEYLSGAVAIGVDTNGVTIATRAGERHIAASRVIDARMKMPDAAGAYDVSWAIVTNRAAPCVGYVRRRVCLPDGSPTSRARAEREIRDAAFDADLIDMAPMGRFSQVGAIRERKESSPFVTSADVVVVGGGTAGAPAAVAAARSGAKTVVVEWLNVLGGITTEGRIGGYYHGNRRGFTSEIDKAMKGVAKDYCLAKGEWYRQELGRLGAEVWFGALAYGVRMEGNRVAAVKVALADGTCAEIRCKVVVDASGNCDIAAAAGCDTEYLSAKELSLQGAGVAPQPLGLTGVNSDIGFVDETCPKDIFGFLLRTRLSVPDRTWNVSQMSDSRERRRLLGEMRITPLDILAGRRYRDTICVTKSNFDTHGQTDSDIFFVKSPGKRGDVHHAHVPYRCLLPKRIDGLLVAGLGVSVHRDAMPVLRMQPDVQNVGYAAGLAAAQAAMRGVPPRGIDVADLQRRLVEKGCIDAADISDSDSPPPDEAVFKVEECQKLHERLKDASWDEGWNFKGMSQFGRSVSDVDSALIALGTCRYGFAA